MKKILTFALLASMLLTLPAVAKDDKKDNKRKSYNMNDYNTSKNPRSIKEDLIEFLKPGEVYSPTPNFSAPKKAEEAAAEADANADKSKDSAAGAVLNDLSTVQNTTLTDA